MFNLLSVCLPHIANRKSRSYPLYLSFTVSVSLSPLLSSRLKFFLLVNYQFNCSYLQTNLHLLGTCFCSDLSFSVSLSLSCKMFGLDMCSFLDENIVSISFEIKRGCAFCSILLFSDV